MKRRSLSFAVSLLTPEAEHHRAPWAGLLNMQALHNSLRRLGREATFLGPSWMAGVVKLALRHLHLRRRSNNLLNIKCLRRPQASRVLRLLPHHRRRSNRLSSNNIPRDPGRAVSLPNPRRAPRPPGLASEALAGLLKRAVRPLLRSTPRCRTLGRANLPRSPLSRPPTMLECRSIPRHLRLLKATR